MLGWKIEKFQINLLSYLLEKKNSVKLEKKFEKSSMNFFYFGLSEGSNCKTFLIQSKNFACLTQETVMKFRKKKIVE
jgi:hypothetical protein